MVKVTGRIASKEDHPPTINTMNMRGQHECTSKEMINKATFRVEEITLGRFIYSS